MPSINRLGWAVSAAALLGLCVVSAQNTDPLERGFQDPPDSARPRVWWHWMNGNITKEGIKLDLEWMKRVGIGGFQNFDAALNTPQVVEHRLVYMTPEWKDAFRYAVTMADQLGLEMAIAGSPGWSETGGPWVQPSAAMKKIVWSETSVAGGQPFHGVLPKPPSVTGPFQNIPRGGGSQPEFYADTAVVAYRAPEAEQSAVLPAQVTSSGGHFDFASLAAADLGNPAILPGAPVNESAWILFEFAKPQRLCAFTLASQGGGGFQGGSSARELQASDDGIQFSLVAPIPSGGNIPHTISFAPVTARYFRVNFRNVPPLRPPGVTGPTTGNPASTPTPRPGAPAPQAGGPTAVPVQPVNPPPPADIRITRLVLHPAAYVNRFEEKAAFAATPDLYPFSTPPTSAADAVRKQDVIDLTSKMQSDGTLDWTPPAGRWVVLRMGDSLTGARNSPASPEATGLEVDKLSRTHVRDYLTTYLDMYKDTVGPLMGKRGLQYIITDSWEAGVQNWTEDMVADFTRLRGYDPRPWLPVLTGRVVESSEASDRFLWDFRETIADLTAANHYDQIGELLHQRGMGRYTESHENGRAFIGDGMEAKRGADIPMSAMWTQNPGQDREQFDYNADVRESASVAHIYGQNLVAAESLTARTGAWAFSPETLKPTADKELAMGLNRFVIHTSVHQPLVDKAPGLGLGPYGQWFTRNDTWAELAKPWVTYLARSSFMLQQGRFVADVAYFYGEGSNITAEFGGKAPDVPAGYNFDYINADAILHRLTVANGGLITPSGMRYRVLALDPYSQHMTLPVLRKIRDLVQAGGTVAGPKPVDSPSLSDNQVEFRTIADQLWGAGPAAHAFGKGMVYGGPVLESTQAALQMQPDFQYQKPQPDTSLLFVHRELPSAQIYWVDHRNNRAELVEASFRVQGLVPELWHADSGVREPASYRTENGRTIVPLQLNAWDAVFVVFRKGDGATSRTIPIATETQVATMAGPWTVHFQTGRGAPDSITLDTLSSWHQSTDPGVEYYSGSGIYTNTLQAPAELFQKGAHFLLDLGDVKNLAEVTINGKALGIVWLPPFRVDVTDALKPGANTLEIRVTNLWVNRLIGDQQTGVTTKYTLTTQQFYRFDSPLLPSGLLGPVVLLRR